MSERLKAMYERWDAILPTLATKSDVREVRELIARIKFRILCALLVIVLGTSAWLNYAASGITPPPGASPSVQQPQVIVIVMPQATALPHQN